MHSSVLTDQQIQKVHQASMRLLGEVGMEVPHPEALRRFAEAGADVDFGAQRVRLPEELVTWAVQQAGKEFTIYGRNPAHSAAFGVGRRNYNSIAGEASWVDEPGGPRRYATLADVAAAARLGDALEGINVVGAMADPCDVPPGARCVAVMAEMLKNTEKPVTFWFHDRRSAAYLRELAVALRGSEEAARRQPVCYPLLEPISPLRFPFNGVDLLFETARLDLPVHVGPMAQMGLSAPCTLAATMAQENAEILAGICLIQLIKPGLGVCYGGICHAFDMRTTQLIFAGPEQAIFGVAMTQLGKHYGLPVYINVGLTDSKRPDAQAGLEAGVTLMLGAAAGADIFGHLGISGVDQASSLDMLVFQDEVIRYVESVLREVDCSEEAFAFEESLEVGPGGSFIGQDHTARSFRRELWFPNLLDRDFYQFWLENGAKSTEERCRERRERLLREHQVPPLDPALEAELDRIVVAAREELAGGE